MRLKTELVRGRMSVNFKKIGYSILSVVLISILVFIRFQNELAAIINIEKQEHYGILDNKEFSGSITLKKEHFYFKLKGKSLDSNGHTIINIESGRWDGSLFSDTVKLFPNTNSNDSVRILVIVGDSLQYLCTQPAD